MRTNLTEPMTYFIIGLPRSGTTIVASLFNSMEDGFCLGEPHWFIKSQLEMGKNYTIPECIDMCGGKGIFTSKDYAQMHCSDFLLPNLIAYKLRTSSYLLGGYKETYRGDVLGMRMLALDSIVSDLVIIVLREPYEVHESQMRVNWPAEKWPLVKAEEGDAILRSFLVDDNVIPVEYNNFCANPIKTINTSLDGRFQVEGEPILKPSGWVYGDPQANQSTEVKCQKFN